MSRLRSLYRLAYIWLCTYVARAGWYGVKPPQRREEYLPFVAKVRKVGIIVAGIALPVSLAGELFDWPKMITGVIGTVGSVGFYLWLVPALTRRSVGEISDAPD